MSIKKKVSQQLVFKDDFTPKSLTMDKLAEQLKKVSVKPKTKECKFCSKIVTYKNMAKHQRTKRCKLAKFGWQIRESQRIIDMHKLRIVNLRQQQKLYRDT